MATFLGLDTSNYTTSVAIYDNDTHLALQNKRLLTVKDGALGLRQSDAVFSHVKQLGTLITELMEKNGRKLDLSGIAVSTRPRDIEGSYMPCFLVGEMAAQSISAINDIPLIRVSHQSGHIAAALYSSQKLDLVGKPFAAFHLSGGTTECLLVHPSEETIFSVELIAKSLDLKAGQAVDRVGKMLGLEFPAGKHLERLALKSKKRYRIKPSFQGMNCSLSGLQNKCEKMYQDGMEHCDIARFCIDNILAVVDHMTAAIKDSYGNIPIVYSGGVMSNSIIRKEITKKYGGYFAQPEFSSDNAAGVAVLACIAQTGGF